MEIYLGEELRGFDGMETEDEGKAGITNTSWIFTGELVEPDIDGFQPHFPATFLWQEPVVCW